MTCRNLWDICRHDCARRPWLYSAHFTAAHPPAVCSLMTTRDRVTGSFLRLRHTDSLKYAYSRNQNELNNFRVRQLSLLRDYYKICAKCYCLLQNSQALHYYWTQYISSSRLFFIHPLFEHTTSICDWLLYSYSLLCVRQFAFIKCMFRIHFIL